MFWKKKKEVFCKTQIWNENVLSNSESDLFVLLCIVDFSDLLESRWFHFLFVLESRKTLTLHSWHHETEKKNEHNHKFPLLNRGRGNYLFLIWFHLYFYLYLFTIFICQSWPPLPPRKWCLSNGYKHLHQACVWESRAGYTESLAGGGSTWTDIRWIIFLSFFLINKINKLPRTV